MASHCINWVALFLKARTKCTELYKVFLITAGLLLAYNLLHSAKYMLIMGKMNPRTLTASDRFMDVLNCQAQSSSYEDWNAEK